MPNKNKLTKVFDDNALAYDKYRPRYPKEVSNDIIELAQLNSGDSILEIGCGTGQITLDFLKKGFHLTAIEKGASLAKIAASKAASFEHAKIVNSTFEDWQSTQTYKLAISAQAFHWINQEEGIAKTLTLLEKQGSVGLIWNVDKSQETDFWTETNLVYQRYLPMKKGQKGMEETAQSHYDYLKKMDEWDKVEKRVYPWKQTYTKKEYLGLLSTFSGHMAMENKKREKFFKEIEEIIEKHNNRVVRYYQTELIFGKTK